MILAGSVLKLGLMGLLRTALSWGLSTSWLTWLTWSLGWATLVTCMAGLLLILDLKRCLGLSSVWHCCICL